MKEKNYLTVNLPRLSCLFGSKSLVVLFLIVLSTTAHGTTITNENIKLSDYELQQNIVITGSVTSADDGMPIPGVNVILKGTSKGVTTDFDGNYSINVPSSKSVLSFSFIGFADTNIVVGKQRKVNVVLKADVSQLEEVVVVGYGTAKKETLTGSIEQVKAAKFTDLAVANPVLALQGATPGLVVTRSSSRPGGEGISLQIRGTSSINGISPLIVIDGVPALNNNSFYDMNPNDIEAVSVLKGGSASVYGSRAAGGVILVTTKKGKGEVKVEMSSVLRVGTVGIRPPTPTMQQYASIYLQAAAQDSNPNYFFWNESALTRMAAGEEGIYELGGRLGTIHLSNANRFDEMFGNSYSSQHNLSVSGGSEKSNFRIAVGYDQNVGGLTTAYDGAEKYNLRVNYGYNLSERLKFTTNISYFHKHFSGPAGGVGSTAITYDAPLFAAQNPYGQWYGNFGVVGGGKNSIANTVDGGRTNNKTEQFNVAFSSDYKLTDELTLTGSFAMARDLMNYQRYVLNVPTYGWFGEKANSSVNTTPYVFEEMETGTYTNYKGMLNYKKSFGDHNVSGLLAVEAELKTSKNLDARRNGFVDFGVYDLNLGQTDLDVTTNGGAGTWGFYGYIGRLNYDYKEKYLFEFQGRRDGASRFSEGFKWSNYGSVSAGWVLTQEDFLKDNDIVSFLKLRGGYGELGSTSGIGTFSYLSSVGFGDTIFGTTAAVQGTSRADGLSSTTTTWERIETTEAGIDFRLFNKVSGSFDVYKKDNVGMLIRGIIPAVGGATAPYTNIGNLETKGWEFMLGYNDRIGEVDFGINANISNTKNTVTKYQGGQSIVAGLNSVGDREILEGRPVNSYYMYRTDGVFEDQAAVDAYYAEYTGGASDGLVPSQFSPTVNLRPGDTRIVDVNGDKVIDAKDLEFKGDAAPHYVYGLNLNAKYKNFDISAFFQGVLDQKVLRTGYFSYPFVRQWQNQTTAYMGKTWTEENPNAEFPRTSTNSTRSSWNYANKDFMLQNNNYVRLKTLVVGYSLKDLKIANTEIDNLRIYFSGNDLFEFTSLKDGYDPEANSNSNSGSAAYPFMRTWALGVKISL
jgi:TonB-linked SusC/RagA family outer membrane protein